MHLDLFDLSFLLFSQTVCQDGGGDEGDDDEHQVFVCFLIEYYTNIHVYM